MNSNPQPHNQFSALLVRKLLQSVYNEFGNDNYDAERFGPRKKSWKLELFGWVRKNLLHDRVALIPKDLDELGEYLPELSETIEGISFLYDLLEDDYSKDLLVNVVAFHILGYRKIKLPRNNPDYWQRHEQACRLMKKSETRKVPFMNWELERFDLNSIGIPVELFFTASGVHRTFLLKQYEYGQGGVMIKAGPGDTVIDAGGCWGDTALYFANQVGPKGRVHTFEFLPDNLNIFHENLALNKELAGRISIVTKAVSNTSGVELCFDAAGPATKVSSTGNLKVKTESIDDLAAEQKIAKLDFIKMDIEGSELTALQGASKTLKKDRPRLAIALYHDLKDFVTIPKFLESLNLNYSYYIDHFTIHREETILFATPK